MHFVRVVLSLIALLVASTAAAHPHEPTDKRIAITFDDTPRGAGAFLEQQERASMLRTALQNAGVNQAAFFVNPGFIEERPHGLDHILAYAGDGHVIANHTALHSNLTQSTLADFLADLDNAARFLEEVPNARPWFRFPYLNEGRSDVTKRDAARAALAERGLTNGYVTVDASDWFLEQQTIIAVQEGKEIDMIALRDLYVENHVEAAEFNYNLAIETVGYSPAHILLLHETDLAALYVVNLVEALEAKGWAIITADEAYADPFGAYAATYETPSAQGTLTEQVAWEKGLPAPRWYPGNDTRLLEAQYNEQVLGLEGEE